MKSRRARSRPSSPASGKCHPRHHGPRRGKSPQHGRRSGAAHLPPTFEVDIIAISEHGEPLAAPVDRRLTGAADRWIVTDGPAVGKGERALVRVAERHKHTLLLTAIKRIPKQEDRSFIGLVAEGGRVRLMHRDMANVDFMLMSPKDAAEGDFVRVQPSPRPRHGPTPVNVLENLGPAPHGLESLTAIENAGLPTEFSDDALAEAAALPAYVWNDAEARTDWRTLPIVTIDGADARDFDDAVFAEPLETGGHRIVVAIADVAHYVSEGGPLDSDALARGNSTYFPDRVVPMLPERLSNDLCSLRPKVDRPVLGVDMTIDASGKLTSYRFHRATIHSAARLTYTQVQAALDGQPDDTTQPLLPHLRHLLAAYQTLEHARKARGALDLDIPEMGLTLNDDGHIATVGNRERLASHRLIEELMILANVAAASTLAKHKVPGFYRVHDRPDKMKLGNLTATLKPLGFTVPGPEAGHKAWAHLVTQVQSHPASSTLLKFILQSQMQARYDLENIGHYGLALTLYSHFTSPIRRYADLVVHRALITALKLPGNGKLTQAPHHLGHTAESINITERRSQQAEWEARDRMIARYYAQFLGNTFPATVTSAQTFGVFVALENGVEGLLPARLLGWDYSYNARSLSWHAKNKPALQAGSRLDVMLIDADRISGRLTFAPPRKDMPEPNSRPLSRPIRTR